jgi:hypothetical protein
MKKSRLGGLMRVLALAAVGVGLIGLSSAQAYGPWGAWAPRDQYSYCEDPNYDDESGSAWVVTSEPKKLNAWAPEYPGDYGGWEASWTKTQAQGYPASNGTYTYVTATNGQSASANSPVNLTQHRCRAEVGILL